MVTFLFCAVSGVFVLTLLNPFWVLPVFIFGHFFQPVQFFPALREYNPSIMIGSAVLVAWVMNMMFTGNITPARNKQVGLVIFFIMQIFISSALGPLSGFSHVSYLMASIIPFFYSGIHGSDQKTINCHHFCPVVNGNDCRFIRHILRKSQYRHS